MNREELDDLQHKIDYEGGLVEYVCGYGGEMPEDLFDEVEAVKTAVSALVCAFDRLLDENGVERL